MSAAAAMTARLPLPSAPIDADADPRPVFTTLLTSAGPRPTPSALPSASNATTSGVPSDDEYRSSTSRACPSRSQISPMRPVQCGGDHRERLAERCIDVVGFVEERQRTDQQRLRASGTRGRSPSIRSTDDLTVALRHASVCAGARSCIRREGSRHGHCAYTFKRIGEGPGDHVGGDQTPGLYATALTGQTATPPRCSVAQRSSTTQTR